MRQRPQTPERMAYLARLARATERARATIKPGDRISRSLCGGLRGTFTFTEWNGEWLCGRAVSNCHAISVLKVNGQPMSFDDPPPATAWDVVIAAMVEADKRASAEAARKALAEGRSFVGEW